MLTRRELLIRSAGLAAVLPAARLAAALPAPRKLKSIGIHPFHVLPENAAKTFHDLEAIGYREMEIEMPFEDFKPLWPFVQASSLKRVGFDLGEIGAALMIAGKDDELNRIFDQVKKWGFSYVSMSIPKPTPGESSFIERYRAFAKLMNRTGAKCRAAGLGPLLYHTTIFGFKPESGTSGFQTLLDEQDQSVTALEVDVYWVSLAGFDPAEFLRKLTGRVKIIHMKDKPGTLPTMYTKATGPTKSLYLDIGRGSIDWPAVLRAAESAGVEHYMVEPDSVDAGDMVAGGRRSIEYLSKLEF